jgi:hypothetical protein
MEGQASFKMPPPPKPEVPAAVLLLMVELVTVSVCLFSACQKTPVFKKTSSLNFRYVLHNF